MIQSSSGLESKQQWQQHPSQPTQQRTTKALKSGNKPTGGGKAQRGHGTKLLMAVGMAHAAAASGLATRWALPASVTMRPRGVRCRKPSWSR